MLLQAVLPVSQESEQVAPSVLQEPEQLPLGLEDGHGSDQP